MKSAGRIIQAGPMLLFFFFFMEGILNLRKQTTDEHEPATLTDFNCLLVNKAFCPSTLLRTHGSARLASAQDHQTVGM